MSSDSGLPSRYTVTVRGLVLECSIGIRPEEREKRQRVRISVELEAKAEAAVPGEDRRRIINYEKTVAAIRSIAASGHIDLCEGFAERICTACFADERVARVRATVEKLEVFADAEAVGAVLERARPLLTMVSPAIFGIVNITADSFSDGGRYLDCARAIAHARGLVAGGAAIVDLGAAASNPDALAVSAEEEIGRLDPVIAALAGDGTPLSIDTFQPAVQRFAMSRNVAFLNDIQGFPDPALYPELADSACRLIVMHAVHGCGRAQRVELAAGEVWDRLHRFFETRLAALERAGIARDRMIIDPGMGFFLSSRPEPSLRVLAGLGRLKRAFGLPVLISVSRKSFLRAVIGRDAAAETGPATLAAELYAAASGADFIRTHDPAALHDALRVGAALAAAAQEA